MLRLASCRSAVLRLRRSGVRFASSGPGKAAAGSSAATLGKLNALSAAIRQIESAFGKGSVMQLGSSLPNVAVDVIPTGSLTIDHALGVGGLPRGRVVEIYGPESSGKTTVALHVVAQAQKQGLSCCFIDAEHALDPSYASAVGVNLGALYLSQPDTGEQALEIADTLTRSGAMDVIVIDSVAALVPKAEIEGDMGDHHMALQARLMSQALRKLTASLSRSKTLIIFINQIRQKVGVMFGNPDVTPGGNALKFYSSVRMEIRRIGQVKKGEVITGNVTRVKVSKNKVAPPFRTAEFEMTYGHGISRAGEAVDMGVAAGVLKKSGAWYSIASPELLAAVNSAMAGDDAPAAAVAAAAPAVAAVAAPAPAPAKGKKGKGKDAAAAAGAAPATATPAVDPEAAAAAFAAAMSAAAAPAAAPASASPLGPSLRLGEPFMQGKEKMKAFFEEHPRALETAVLVIKQCIRDRGGVLDAGAAPAAGAGKAGAKAALDAMGDEGEEDDGGALLPADGEGIEGGSGLGLKNLA